MVVTIVVVILLRIPFVENAELTIATAIVNPRDTVPIIMESGTARDRT